jgi:DNA recombination protein RmuC
MSDVIPFLFLFLIALTLGIFLGKLIFLPRFQSLKNQFRRKKANALMPQLTNKTQF